MSRTDHGWALAKRPGEPITPFALDRPAGEGLTMDALGGILFTTRAEAQRFLDTHGADWVNSRCVYRALYRGDAIATWVACLRSPQAADTPAEGREQAPGGVSHFFGIVGGWPLVIAGEALLWALSVVALVLTWVLGAGMVAAAAAAAYGSRLAGRHRESQSAPVAEVHRIHPRAV